MGKDVIEDSSGKDEICFLDGVCPEDLFLSKIGMDLGIGVVGATDKLKIGNYFGAANNKIEKITFANGSSWNTIDIGKKIVECTN